MYYIARVHQEGRHWLADFVDAPGCQTFADSMEELGEAAQEAIEGWLEAHLVDGEAPPKPTQMDRQRLAGLGLGAGETLLRVPIPPTLASALSIRWARQEQNMSQGDLAALLGVSQQQVALLEKPDANPTLGSLEKAAKALGLHVDISFGVAR